MIAGQRIRFAAHDIELPQRRIPNSDALRGLQRHRTCHGQALQCDITRVANDHVPADDGLVVIQDQHAGIIRAHGKPRLIVLNDDDVSRAQ
ncbi:hypothetical protein Mal15_01560 [Stieleria maiorica]|uniref:Uncharacterized protein n=1 Tax=Stieleria maiorica TaxID=2795974 RepID=A0A5B9M7W0_9BACT|nr:hypothetical protein Mal15_01560 [Stieleria maiorica]